jgi:hypothetical protein
LYVTSISLLAAAEALCLGRHGARRESDLVTARDRLSDPGLESRSSWLIEDERPSDDSLPAGLRRTPPGGMSATAAACRNTDLLDWPDAGTLTCEPGPAPPPGPSLSELIRARCCFSCWWRGLLNARLAALLVLRFRRLSLFRDPLLLCSLALLLSPVTWEQNEHRLKSLSLALKRINLSTCT